MAQRTDRATGWAGTAGRAWLACGILCAGLSLRAFAQEPAPAVGAGAGLASALYDAEAVRDPMKSLLPSEPAVTPEQLAAEEQAQAAETVAEVVEEPQPPMAVLQGVIWGGRLPQAIINNEVYQVGDSVDGAMIVSIDRRGVVLEAQGLRYLVSPAIGSSSSIRQLTEGAAVGVLAQSTGQDLVSVEAQGGEESGGAR